MKKSKKSGKKTAAATIFLQVARKFGNFTRMQILGAVTLLAGLILVTLLLPGDDPSTQKNTDAPTDIPVVQRAEKSAAKVDKTVIKGANRPPSVTAVMLTPNVVLPGVPVRVEVKVSDPDQDDVRLAYTWKVNGQIVTEQSGEEFDTTTLRKGDLLTVTVIPTDGKEQGVPLDSHGILVQNHPPEITSLPTAGISSGYFQYQVTAKDADNDPLQFSLEGAPAGMTINPTGLIQWNVPMGLKGKQQVRVIVSDGAASSFQAFNLNLAQQ